MVREQADQAGGAKHTTGGWHSLEAIPPSPHTHTQGHNVDKVGQWMLASSNCAEFENMSIQAGKPSAGKHAYRQNTDTGKRTDSVRKENHEHRMQKLQENSPAPVACDSTVVGAKLRNGADKRLHSIM